LVEVEVVAPAPVPVLVAPAPVPVLFVVAPPVVVLFVVAPPVLLVVVEPRAAGAAPDPMLMVGLERLPVGEVEPRAAGTTASLLAPMPPPLPDVMLDRRLVEVEPRAAGADAALLVRAPPLSDGTLVPDWLLMLGSERLAAA
jgi:hypothetical protein